MEAASSVARALGLPGANPDAVAICRNKWNQAVELRRKSIQIPETSLATSVRDVENILAQATLPVVVKPVIGSGSSGVRLCDNTEAAIRAFENAKRRIVRPSGFAHPRRTHPAIYNG
ncbi:ATP-grasp domain-containing protein (plasmid) [Sinorhizobium meliloti]|nr:ATP-grasp domain-containing protein [Sinorhizobium meliloti]WKL34245.1 ATP-grasp domain-containing protein [Sinorhizobium meliloti]